MTNFSAWLRDATGGASGRQIAERLGAQNTAVSWWLRSDQIRAGDVIRIARGFDLSPIDALIAADYLTEDDIARESRTLRDVPSRLMLEELLRRAIADDLAP